MQLAISIPSDITYIIQALVLFSIATEFLPAVRRVLPKFLGGSRKPSLPLVPGMVAVETPVPIEEAPMFGASSDGDGNKNASATEEKADVAMNQRSQEE
jgi:hypothetical protein